MSKRISRCMASAAIVASSLSLLGSVALAQSSAGQYQEMPGFKRFFDNAGVEGTIIVHDLRKGTSVVYNPARADTGFLPASTFKIPNSLIALDLDIVKDVDGDIFKWSGKPFTWDREAVLVEGKPILPEACNADITLRTAFPNSCVPVYQDIARKVGAERYKGILSSINYGNVDISSVAIDRFWLEGKLRISARHQIEFLKKLYREDLPFSKHAMRQVKDIMTAEKTATHTIRAKSGYAFPSKPGVGWWVGWIERGDDVYLFATNIDLPRPELALLKARVEITKAVLRELGIL